MSDTGVPIYADYRPPKTLRRPQKRSGPTWENILDQWDLVVLDLLEVFGADWDDPTLVRSWVWWRDRITGLLSTECRLSRALLE